MISNHASYRVKASKSPREVYNDNENQQANENHDNNGVDEDVNDHGYGRDARYRGGSRTRTTEFRPSSWDTERGRRAPRGRGGSRGRNDRDYDYYGTRKYDSNNRSSETSGSHGKVYEPEKKNDLKLNFPEDTRISKLLRRLSMETDQEISLAVSAKLLEVLLLPDNADYVRRCFHILSDSMYDILHVAPGQPAKKQAARALGRMGWIMAQGEEFERYQTFIFSKMATSNDDMQALLIETFKEVMDFERRSPILQNNVDSLLNTLVTVIESVECAPVFKAILEVIILIVELYPDNFLPLFRDTVDLLFGWHIDHTQPLANIEFISESLQKIYKHFQYNLDFSYSLVENFLEDISSYSKQINDGSENNFLEHVIVLILAFNTILKCLGRRFHPSENKFIKVEFIYTCLNEVITTATTALETIIPDNLVIAANNCIAMLLTNLDTKSQNLTTNIYNLIELELCLINEFSDATIISMLMFISEVLKELSANLPIELIEKLVGPKSEIVKLRSLPYKNIQSSVICVYQALLNLKNVSLVQEAYRYVLGDLEMTYKIILPHVKPFVVNNPFENEDYNFTMDEAQLNSMFLLRCLSQLANASSLIVMWALKPSVLEVVALHLEIYNPILAKKTPTLQYGLLYLLFSHCRCYNHYISTSSLVVKKEDSHNLVRFSLSETQDDLPHSSPNSGNFTIILETIHKTLSSGVSHESTILLLKWFKDILIKSEVYLPSLYDKNDFTLVTKALIQCGYNINDKVVLEVSTNLEKLLSNKQLSWNNVFLKNVSSLCKLHMDSNKENIKKAYTKLALHIPWDIAVVEFNKSAPMTTKKYQSSFASVYTHQVVSLAQYLHQNGALYTDLSPLHFKKIMEYLLKNQSGNSDWLQDIFVCSLSLQFEAQMNMEQYYDLGMNSKTVLDNWFTLESAQFCVNMKLRTPLGKPNETFTKIECGLNELGNTLLPIKKGDAKKETMDYSLVRRRVKTLLTFIEHLEKSIYNASEGCATAMPAAQKAVRSFFTANFNTCNEWINRIRMVVIHTALHSGEFTIALRHGQAFLRDLASADKVNTVEFERTVMFLVEALLNLRETEVLYGLYIWCRSLNGRKYHWIKCAAEQSSKKYELAIEGYHKILADAKKSEDIDGSSHSQESIDGPSKKIDIEILHFISDQIIICHKEFNNWEEILKCRDEENVPRAILDNPRKYWFYNTDWECIKNLDALENSNFVTEQLSHWEYVDEPKSWSGYDLYSTTEDNLYNTALNLITPQAQGSQQSARLDLNLTTVQKSIQEFLNIAPCEMVQKNFLLYYVANGLKNIFYNLPASTVFLVSENFENEIEKLDSSVLRKILWWSEYFAKVQTQEFSSFCSNLRLDVIKRARKEKNLTYALKHVRKFLIDKSINLENSQYESLDTLSNIFISKVGEITMWSVDTAKTVNEIIKLLYLNEGQRHETFNLCALSSAAISKYTEMYGGTELRKISSKMLLKLASWLQCNENIPVTDVNRPLGKFLMVLPEIGMLENNPSNVIPINEMAIGKLLKFSVQQCVGLAKGWCAFGTWCYKWGRKIVDHSSNIKNNLSEEDCFVIKNIVPQDASDSDLAEIFAILSERRKIIDEEDLDCNAIQTSEMIQSQLQNVLIMRSASEAQLLSLVQIWRNTQKRIYIYYALSAEAYFKYLHLVMNSENVTKSTDCNTTTVTLRLLRLIVKYALELECILDEGLQSTPTQPWKVIIPQLFSRLNHPESYVRHRVSDLLCRVAEDAPHLITFPAVVGALEGGIKFDFSEITLPKDCLSQDNECNENELNEEEDNFDSDLEEPINNSMQGCFKTMVETLSKQDSETITQVQTLVKELRRITLLWDELWLGTLSQHQSEINKRQLQLEQEIKKVYENGNLLEEEKISLIAEKHRIIIKPIIFVLEQLRDVTSVEAETPHEKEFQEKYADEIDDVIDKLKKPDCPEKPQESLQPLKGLQKKLQHKFHKRASYSLKMNDISPVLASFTNTLIAMPGLTTITKSRVTISHISNVVSVLPTKTKPKKLVFYGSDGQTYAYLFKGLEDLHLDERIMQFLSIANTMMAQNADPTEPNLFRARHYSVIPLGPRSGLISWVDGTVPVFSLYKRWQQREMAKPSNKNAFSTTTTVLRPSELFYNKLHPLLLEHGVKNIENRKEWPLSILKKVLTELIAETPHDLLTKELWCNSISASDWWKVTKRYSYSVAVMSIIGYIIGLGDRHLDNVLVDLTSGEVIHIDYNVCFEKGKTLRVPEKVPFRLTPNLIDALGVTGVEGIFRLTCENVLKTMRKGRETLLTLLEAFVYDPLIDWTVGGEVLAGTTFGNIPSANNTKQTRRELEKEVTISMFNVRCTEMRADWNQNKEDIIIESQELIDRLNEWLVLQEKITQTEDKLQDLHQQMALIKEAEAHGAKNHSLYALPSKFNVYHKTHDALQTAKKDIENIILDGEKHVQALAEGLHALECPELNQWGPNLGSTQPSDLFDLVRDFLHNAGKDDLITQCDDSKKEIITLTQNQSISAQKCLHYVQEYQGWLSQCPKAFLEKHRIYIFVRWANILLKNPSVESCDLIYEQFRSFLENTTNSNNIVTFLISLESFYKEIVTQLNKLYEEVSVKNTVDVQNLDNLYQNAKSGVSSFLLGGEKNADKAFSFVIATELLILNRNFLTLETAAHRSGDWLIKLTSRDGDWFLEDLVLSSNRAIELINNLPLRLDEHLVLHQIVNNVKIANSIYMGLQELHFNFHTIILPESMKKIQSEDVTALQMVADLNKLVLSIGVPIPDIIQQMVKVLPCLLMQMEISESHQFILARVAEVKAGFQMLLNSQSDVLTPGKMLLLGFNGLFDKLTTDCNSLVAAINQTNVPNSWKKVNQVKDARSISAHICNKKVHDILGDIFLLKRLQAMSEFFNLTVDMCQSFKGTTSIAYSDDTLVKPIRQFIADFISRQLLGVATENIAYSVCYLLQHLGFDLDEEIEQRDVGAENKVPLDDLYHKSWNTFLKQGLFSQNALSQASTLESNLKHAWIKIQETQKLQHKVTLLQSSQMRLHNQISVHNFMYEDILTTFNIRNPVRSKLLHDMQQEFANLTTYNKKIVDAYNNQDSLIETAAQRLNWAKGANPDVIEISLAFKNAVEMRNKRLHFERLMCDKLISICNVTLRHELLRMISAESKAYDKMFLTSFEKWRMACQYTNSKAEALTTHEEGILKLLTPDLVTDNKWLTKISEKISELISIMQSKLAEEKSELVGIHDIIIKLDAFKNLYKFHCNAMSDVKTLIKSMAKIEDYAIQTQQFIQNYRTYNEMFAPIFTKFKKEVKKDEVEETIGLLMFVNSSTEAIYDALLNLEVRKSRPSLTRQDGFCAYVSPQKQESITTKGQQRNAYAVGVWRRVKMKLEGRDPDIGRKYTAQEQVEYVIQEASSIDNLALLYEGWTPWV